MQAVQIEAFLAQTGLALEPEPRRPPPFGLFDVVRVMLSLALADGRPAHLTRAHQALRGLPEDDQKRLGVIADWKDSPHQLTYRQVEHTAPADQNALAKEQPGGAASTDLQQLCDRLLEASIPAEFKDASSSLAVD